MFFLFLVINWIAFQCSIRRDGAIKNTQGERVANHVKRGREATAPLSEGTETYRQDSPCPRLNFLLRSPHYWVTATPYPGLGPVPSPIARPARNGRLGECSRTRCCRSSLPAMRIVCKPQRKLMAAIRKPLEILLRRVTRGIKLFGLSEKSSRVVHHCYRP